MTGDQIANLAYLGLLGAAIAGLYFTSERRNLKKTTQQAMVWVLIFVGVIAAVGLWGDIRRDVTFRQAVVAESVIETPLRPDGHYYLTLEINEVPVDFVVDTGATDMVLSQRDAARIGFDPADLRYIGTAMTANGPVRTASVTLDEVKLGPITDQGVRAVVNEGDLFGSLLGMGYLQRFAAIEIRDNRLILTR